MSREYTLRALGDVVLVRRMGAEEKTPSGLIIPEAAQEKPQRGEVMAVGPDVDGTLHVGNIVIFGRYSGMEIKVKGEDWIALRAADLLAVIEEPD